jgi:NADPH:quinone reductase-like Zn-dependent oxidoreductase
MRQGRPQTLINHTNQRNPFMSAKLKRIQDQVVVITGASSGIGLATAELLAEKGASVQLANPSGNALNEITH